MAAELLEFDWDVSPSGYRWVEATFVPDEPYGTGTLAPMTDTPAPKPALVWAGPEVFGPTPPHPHPEPALFRLFAEVNPNKESILAFANRYGDLGIAVKLHLAIRDPDAGPGPARGTFLVVWQNQIADMQRLAGLWDLLLAGDRERLAQHIEWTRGGPEGLAVHFDSNPTAGTGRGPSLGSDRVRVLIASRQTGPELLEQWDVDDPVGPAWVYLQWAIDEHLRHLASEVPTSMVWDPRAKRPVLRLLAPTLASAVWLQFAEAISTSRTFSRCRECQKWFPVGPELARSNRRFCSNACRSKAYRERQDRARRLRTEGKSFEEIAVELESDVATVRGWITGLKE